MEFRTSIAGSLVALVTPMRADGSVDYEVLHELLEWHIGEGTDAIIAVGTTGESATLEVAEHLEVVARSAEFAKGRIPIIAGTGANSTSEAKILTREAQAAGADACLSVTPYYNKPPQEGLYRHFAEIAQASDMPVILYNVPGRTGCDMLPETVGRLLSFDNIVGIKEAKGCLQRIQDLLDLGQGLAVYSGDDATARESILMGCRGDISVTANVAPALMHQMCVAALAGDVAKAEELDAQLQGLHDKLFIEPNPIPVKWALNQMNKIASGMRLPMVELNQQYHAELQQALRQAGINL